MTNKIYISDIHFGDGSKTDDFHRDKEFLDFLNYINDIDAQLIMVGDIFELWQSNLEHIWWVHEKVIKALAKMRYPYEFIYGNHDYIPYSKYEPEVYSDGNGVIAQHGHQYDVFNKYKNPLWNLHWPIGRYVTVIIAELERWVHKDADVWAEKMRDKFGDFLWEAAKIQNRKRMSLKDLCDNLIDKAYSQTKPGHHRVRIYGHSHRAELIKFDHGGVYANCGSWVDNETPTYIQTDGNIISLRLGLTHGVIKSETY